MNQFIYRIQLNRPELLTDGPSQEEADILSSHASYLEELATTSKVLLAGRTQVTHSNAFGIVILNCETELEAHNIMNNDPAVKHNIMTAELFPYAIAAISSDIVSIANR